MANTSDPQYSSLAATPEPWLDFEGIMAHMKLSRRTIQKLIQDKNSKFPYARVNGHKVFSKASALDAWLLERGRNLSDVRPTLVAPRVVPPPAPVGVSLKSLARALRAAADALERE